MEVNMSVYRRGDNSPEILKIKTAMNRLGFTLQLTNLFDLEMDAAVRILQKTSRIKVDGIVGPNTMRAIQNTFSLPALLTNKNGIKVLHDVKYQTQRDNKYNPGGTCGPTSMSMAMAFYGAKPTQTAQLEDEIFELLQTPEAQAEFKRSYPWAVGKYNPHNIHGMLQWICNKHFSPVKDSFESGKTWEQLTAALREGPIVVSGHFTGNGHVVCFIGETTSGDIIVHDPYGNWSAGYQKKLPGEYVVYSADDMKRILKPGSGSYHFHRFKK
jgi:hypothetical protein